MLHAKRLTQLYVTYFKIQFKAHLLHYIFLSLQNSSHFSFHQFDKNEKDGPVYSSHRHSLMLMSYHSIYLLHPTYHKLWLPYQAMFFSVYWCLSQWNGCLLRAGTLPVLLTTTHLTP